MCPFSTVEAPSFKKLVLTGNCNTLHVMTRKSLVGMLKTEFQVMKSGLIKKYSEIDYFCLTADLWSSHRRTFLGVTIHWICTKTYSRQQNALSCKRIKGAHTSEVIAYHLDEIIKSFELPRHKILKIITDGGSNFKKAFKEHQEQENEDVEIEEINLNLNDLLDEVLRNDMILLPPHGICASHNASLIMTADTKSRPKEKKKGNIMKKIDEVMTPEEEARKIFQEEFYVFRETTLDPVFKKCQDLFNKQNRSSKSADLIHSYLNRYLLIPSDTRWNSMYDSVLILSGLLDSNPVEMEKVFTGLGLEKIQPYEHLILKEYIKVIYTTQIMSTSIIIASLHEDYGKFS